MNKLIIIINKIYNNIIDKLVNKIYKLTIDNLNSYKYDKELREYYDNYINELLNSESYKTTTELTINKYIINKDELKEQLNNFSNKVEENNKERENKLRLNELNNLNRNKINTEKDIESTYKLIAELQNKSNKSESKIKYQYNLYNEIRNYQVKLNEINSEINNIDKGIIKFTNYLDDIKIENIDINKTSNMYKLSGCSITVPVCENRILIK